MPTIRSAQVAEPGGQFSIVERELPEPGRGHVRITVEACGVCRSDAAFINAAFPDVPFPLIPGHEIAGRIDAVGDSVEGWAIGERVAVGWFGGNCGICLACREGDFIHCERLQVPGWAYPGGYSEAVVVPSSALARIPDAISAVEAAPMAALASPPTTHCGTARRARVISSPCSAWVVSGTWACSSPTSSASKPSP